MEWYVEGCGGKMFHPEGILTSPNYPKRYEHDITCLWEINVDYGFNIEVTVLELDMELSTNCEYDYLDFASDSNFNRTILKMCHSLKIPTVVTSDGNKMFIKFNSDDSNSGKGFNLTYKSVISNCGGLFSGSNGIIQTPNYPSQNYENKKNCEWNIKSDPSHSLTFQFTDFDLESSDNCTKDVVEIYDPVFDKLLWRGCGNQLPNQTVFKSQYNELNVRLRTDDTVTAKGFKGNFSINCGARIITNSTGELQYQRSSDNTECIWTIISADPSKKVTVTFTAVNIFVETIDGCLSKVEVFDGDSDEGALKASFCGSKTPPAIFSNGNALTIKLNSSGLTYVSEFDVHYSVLDNSKKNFNFLF